MPELPDIQVFADNLNHQFAGKQLVKLKLVNSNKLKDSPKELTKNLEGKVLEEIYRSGKEMRFRFQDGTVLGLHLMLTGDIFTFKKVNEQKFSIIELHFEGGEGIALTDRMRNANVKLFPEEKGGVDALELTYGYLKEVFQRKSKVKEILMDQDIIKGIGNGYSDEILWEARISPYSIAEAIPDDKVKELLTLIKKVLKNVTKTIGDKYPRRINDEVKEFHKIHSRDKTVSPTGYAIIIDKWGSRKTYYTEEQFLYQ